MGVRYADTKGRGARLESELQTLLPRIVEPRIIKIILFGSAARGTLRSTSDLDLLILTDDDSPPTSRVDDIYRRARPQVAVDFLVYTPEELARAEKESSFVRAILREGRVIYDRSAAVAGASAARSG